MGAAVMHLTLRWTPCGARTCCFAMRHYQGAISNREVDSEEAEEE